VLLELKGYVMGDRIEPEATIASIQHLLADQEKFVRTVLGSMAKCRREHGNAFVRIGITGEGKVPYYKLIWDDGVGVEQLYGSFGGSVMDEKYKVHVDTWSTTRMSYKEVETLLGSIRGYSPRS
jgi:hypothetical protein